MKRTLVFAATLCLALSVHAETPEALAQSYFKLLQDSEYEKIAAMYDAKALDEFKEMMGFMFEIPDANAELFLGRLFGEGSTKDSVRAMSGEAFFQAFLSGAMAQAGALGEVKFDQVEVLGAVPEGSDVQHVLTRAKMGVGELKVETMEVISFKKDGEGWGIMMQGKMKGMAAQLKRALGQ